MKRGFETLALNQREINSGLEVMNNILGDLRRISTSRHDAGGSIPFVRPNMDWHARLVRYSNSVTYLERLLKNCTYMYMWSTRLIYVSARNINNVLAEVFHVISVHLIDSPHGEGDIAPKDFLNY